MAPELHDALRLGFAIAVRRLAGDLRDGVHGEEPQ